MQTMKFILTKVHMDLPRVTKEPLLFCGLFNNDRLIELNCQKESKNLALESICIGRVENIVASMKGAFVRIAKDELAYLPLDEADSGIFSKKQSQKGLSIGDELLVQVCKEPIKTKGSTLTTRLQISGKYMVFSLDFSGVSISKKIIGNTRNDLKASFETLKATKAHLSDNREYGIIVRTNAMYATTEEWSAEFECLYEKFNRLLQTGVYKSLYTVIYSPENAVIRRIRDFLPREQVEIVTDQKALYDEIISSGVLSDHLTIRLYEDSYSLNKLYSVSTHLENALSTKVWLKSGAYIIIEPTEALTVIDVNSGKNTKKETGQNYYLDINLEALDEIMCQLQLRNISGIIVVDFIDMPNKSQQAVLVEKINDLCKKQRIPTSFVEMTKLNLAHIIRKKIQQPLREQVKE